MAVPSMPFPQSIRVPALPTSIDYTTKDYSSFFQAMMAYAQQVFPDWTPSSEGDFGVAMVELLSMCLDIQSYYADRISQEAYLPTATQRNSLLNIAQLLGYVPSNGAAAVGQVTFQSSPSSPETTIPAGTQVSTSYISTVDQPVIYQTTEDVTCPGAGGTTTPVQVQQGVTYTMVQLGTSTGTPGQTYQIPQTGVLDGSVSIYVQTQAGTQLWQPVSYLVDYGTDDIVYSTWVDQNGLTNVLFGDGINGLIPGVGLTIYVTYTIIVGSAGNVAAGLVGTVVSALPGIFIPFESDGVTYQSTEMTGGSDPETNDQIRANAPASFQSQYRAVSPADFASLALGVPGVLMASAVANHSTSVTLYVLGPNYLTPTPPLVDAIYDYFTNRTLAGVTLNVAAPSLIKVDVGGPSTTPVNQNVQVQVLANYSQSRVEDAVLTALAGLLSPPAQTFGSLLTVSDIYNAILAVPGVDWCVIPVFSREDVGQSSTNPIQFRPSEICQPGSLFVQMQGGF